jgi:hypothetical protein
MDDNGWLTTGLMYAGMIISVLIGKPLQVLRWTVRRFPRATVTIVLAACGVLIGEKTFTGQIDQRVLSFALIVVIVGFAGMIAVMVTRSASPESEPIPVNPDNWLNN